MPSGPLCGTQTLRLALKGKPSCSPPSPLPPPPRPVKLQISAKELEPLVGYVSAVADSGRGASSSAVNITSHLLLEAKDGQLEITGTDAVTYVRACAATEKSSKEGACAAPAKLLERAVRALSGGGEIALSLEGDALRLAAGRGVYDLPTLPAGDYPGFPEPGKSETSFELAVADLRRLLAGTAFCASNNETRYYLNGVYLHPQDGKLVAAATDGLRLARCEIPAPKAAAAMKGVILPRKAVAQVEALLERAGEEKEWVRGGSKGAGKDAGKGGDEKKEAKGGAKSKHAPGGEPASLRLRAGESMAWIELGTTRIATKLVDGAFPDYRRVIPAEGGAMLTAGIDELRAALLRAAVVADRDQGSAVKLTLAKDELSFEAGDRAHGSFADKITASYKGGGLAIGFNAELLGEFLPALAARGEGAGRARLQLSDESTPLRMSREGDEGLVYVLMPLRL